MGAGQGALGALLHSMVLDSRPEPGAHGSVTIFLNGQLIKGKKHSIIGMVFFYKSHVMDSVQKISTECITECITHTIHQALS